MKIREISYMIDLETGKLLKEIVFLESKLLEVDDPNEIAQQNFERDEYLAEERMEREREEEEL